MKQNIAIEPNLTPVKDYLSSKGYNVEMIEQKQSSAQANKKYDAYIVTGQNSNFMGIHDTDNKAVVVNAAGLTPEQIYNELQQRL